MMSIILVAVAALIAVFFVAPVLAQEPNTESLSAMNGSELAEINLALDTADAALGQAIDVEEIAATVVILCTQLSADYNLEGINTCIEYYKARTQNNIAFLEDTKVIRDKIEALASDSSLS